MSLLWESREHLKNSIECHGHDEDQGQTISDLTAQKDAGMTDATEGQSMS